MIGLFLFVYSNVQRKKTMVSTHGNGMWQIQTWRKYIKKVEGMIIKSSSSPRRRRNSSEDHKKPRIP